MNAKDILLRAAKLIDSRQCGYCCDAINEASHGDLTRAQVAKFKFNCPYCRAEDRAEDHFAALYSPYENPKGAAEFWSKEPENPVYRKQRVLALLFAAHSYGRTRHGRK